MKTPFNVLFLAAGLVALPAFLRAQPTAHYIPGIEGIKAGTLPPPGLYLRDYTVAYTATRLNNGAGTSVGPANTDIFVFAQAPRLIWISETKFLGGFVGVDGLVPVLYKSFTVGPFDDSTFGLFDIFAETTLSWHFDRYDLGIGAGAWMPTGDSPSLPYQLTTRAGLGYWTPMFTAGGTVYLDAEKTWAVSALSRYEINTEQRDTNITPGDACTLEWGVSKTLNKTIDVGVAGYYQTQTGADSGTGAITARDRVAAIGPEISMMCPEHMLFVSLRYNYEFMAENRAQGHTIALTLTKRF